MNSLTTAQKIYQMFILGLDGEELCANPNFLKALDKNLGGVIFFTQNINSSTGFKKLISDINSKAYSPLFLSIDQEGGRVERTLTLHNGSKYLNARESAKKGEAFVKTQTTEISKELKDLGINMNFAPVLDVDTNPNNPIIAERSFSSDEDEVVRFSKIAAKTFLENNIIPVGKHFPGHGDTCVDSHKDMPELNLSIEELENVHIKPFASLINDLPAIMVAHIHYSAFDNEKLPGSLSKNVITNYLRNKLHFEGLILSDDMVMGGVKGYSSLQACMMGIEAGINMFIFRGSDDSTIEFIEELVLKAQNGEIDMNKVDYSVEKISQIKKLNV